MDDKHHRRIEAGESLFREGDPGDCAFLIEHGQVHVCREREGTRHTLAMLGPGSLIGEMSLLDRLPRSASAIAEVPTVLRVITRQHLQDRLDSADPLLRMLLRMVLERYRAAAPTPGAEPLEDDDTQARRDRDAAFGHLKLAQELEEALAGHEFTLHYQPIIALDTMTTAGFEALIRWNSPTRGFVPPGEFIPAVEESALIVDLGRWVMREACAALSRLDALRGAGQAPLYMSANLAGRQLLSPDLIGDVRAAVADSGIAPRQLKLELTESQLISNWDICLDVLGQVRRSGVQVAVDDFGTGYSSLSYLHRFPADALKVDRSFVTSMLSDERSRTILDLMGQLAHGLGMHIIAEGVEHAAQARYLRGHQFEYAQGFLFSKAVPFAEAEKLVAAPWMAQERIRA